jgi:enoyl-CoA hydratase
MPSELISRRHQDGVTWLTIERPDKLNALNAAVIAALDAAMDHAAADEAIRVVVLTGSGEKAFVAGADVAEISALSADELPAYLEQGLKLMRRIERLGKPVIARVNGYALGGGCELALACTLRIASSNALFGLPEVKLGLLPGYGGTQRMTRLVGKERALHLMLGGDPVSAQQALEWGLVSQVCAIEDLDAAVQALAGKLARAAPLAMRAVLEVVHTGADLDIDAAIAGETAAFLDICNSADMREGTSAFLEKRTPVFSGK